MCERLLYSFPCKVYRGLQKEIFCEPNRQLKESKRVIHSRSTRSNILTFIVHLNLRHNRAQTHHMFPLDGCIEMKVWQLDHTSSWLCSADCHWPIIYLPYTHTRVLIRYNYLINDFLMKHSLLSFHPTAENCPPHNPRINDVAHIAMLHWITPLHIGARGAMEPTSQFSTEVIHL